mmetsp:Transcript_34088/g.51409  ORF Transcript_34088/g.51409 Transcript_34088/m.51409 type:complete len:88 (-) Transcript_34088:180-443(-)
MNYLDPSNIVCNIRGKGVSLIIFDPILQQKFSYAVLEHFHLVSLQSRYLAVHIPQHALLHTSSSGAQQVKHLSRYEHVSSLSQSLSE